MIIILGCSKSKVETSSPIPIMDLYLGALYKMGRKYAERQGATIWILSAKYGLVPGDTMVETYDLKMTPKIAKGMIHMNAITLAPLRDVEEIFVLGGETYRSALPRYVKPLIPSGTIGKMLQSMKALLQ